MVEKVKKEGTLRKVLVTGSSGMLGVDLCRELSCDYDVIGLDIKVQNAAPAVLCDITDRDRTIKSIVSAKPDLVIHAAAWTDVDGCEEDPDKAKRINEEGTAHVAISTSELNIPLLYISTDFVFDGNKGSPYSEDDSPSSVNVYGKSKFGGEKIVRALDKYLIVRTGWLYGLNGKNFVDTILDEAKKEKELRVVNDQIGSPTYTKDFAKAIRRLLKLLYAAPDIYHISNKGWISWFDYAKEILKIRDIDDVRLTPIKSDQLDRPAKRPLFSVLDNTKFEEATGFIMRPWQEALREYLREKK